MTKEEDFKYTVSLPTPHSFADVSSWLRKNISNTNTNI